MSIRSLSVRLVRRLLKQVCRSERTRRHRRQLSSRFEQFEPRCVMAVNPLALDLNLIPTNSDPAGFVEVNNVLYFSASTPESGRELWRSDGTAAGTWMVKDIYSGTTGSNPTDLVNANGTLLFNAINRSTGVDDLFRSDGTLEGTRPVLASSMFTGISNLTEVNGGVFFSASSGFDIPSYGEELWKDRWYRRWHEASQRYLERRPW